MRRYLLILLLFIAVGTATAAERVLTVLATTDVHAHIGPGHLGGDWLRLATLIERERTAAGGADATLLLDAGDTLQGGLIGVVSRGEAGVLLLDHLRYDAWAPGNHDLDFGTARLAELIARTRTPALNANLNLQGEPLPAWRLIEKGDLRVAVIGMNSPFLADWLWGDAYRDFHVQPTLAVLEDVLPEVMATRPHAIILAIHAGWGSREANGDSTIVAIARRYPQIDLIIGGHSHIPVGGMALRGAWFVQPGAHAECLARIRLHIDPAARRVTRVESALLPLAEDTPVDPAARAAVATWLQRAETEGAIPLATPPREFNGGDGLPGADNAISEFICRAIAARSGAVIALHGTHNRYRWSADRPITVQDLFITIPYENELAVISLTPEQLTAVITEQLATEPARYRHGVWGLQVDLTPRGDVHRLSHPDGSPLAADQRLDVATSGFLLAGGGGRYPILAGYAALPECRARDLKVTTREALREYILGDPDWSAPRPWIRRLSSSAAAREAAAP